MDRFDWLIVFIAYEGPDGPEAQPLSPVDIQKGMFVLSQAVSLPEEERYDFEAFDFGPMCGQLYGDTQKLVREGMITPVESPSPRWSYYQPTEDGRSKATRIAANPRVAKHIPCLEVIRALLQELSFGQKVSAIYAAYPDYAIATAAPDLLPGSTREAGPELARLFTAEEIRFRAEVLKGQRQIARGEYVKRAVLIRSCRGS